MADVSAIVPILNDPRVYMYIQGPPNPYLPEHGQQWLIAVKSETDKALRDLQEASSDDKLKIVDHCPVRSLREVKEDGTDAYLGDIGIGRWGWEDITNHTEKQRLIAENTARKPGDPDIVWGLGGTLRQAACDQRVNTSHRLSCAESSWARHHDCSSRYPS
jgi:hypothetical protein